MIVKMLHIDLLCLAKEKETTLEKVCALGAVHIIAGAAESQTQVELRAKIEDDLKAIRLVTKLRKECAIDVAKVKLSPLSAKEILDFDEEISERQERIDDLSRQIGKYAPYGDFDPELARKVMAKVENLSDYVALPEVLPEKRLSAMEKEREALLEECAALQANIFSADIEKILDGNKNLRQILDFEQAKDAMEKCGEICVLSGWLPEKRLDGLRESAAKNYWGLLAREASADEVPPTLIEPPRFFGPVKALFAGLGISPAYTEADVSIPFMCYFTVFFAMLVGDGAYGLIFLAATLWGWKATKAKRSVALRSALVLMTVFSAATVVWGLLSNTWFGAQIPWCNNWPSVKWLADPSYHNMMLLCFTIGVSHLMIARIWNGICKINSLGCLAEFGWAGVLLFMYFVTNSIVGIFKGIPGAMFWVFGVSLACIFLFTLKPCELKTRGAELGMLPLNIMSALGDIISYVRLFAVGLASVKVAENFNQMALNIFAGEHNFVVGVVLALAMAAIMIFGHVLNIVMAGLSILVHAVRLNTLEFSNHKGVTWSGYSYNPFRKKGE